MKRDTDKAAGTRRKILAMGRKLIGQKKYENFRLEDLLSGLNLSKGGFYHHFKSVEQLLAELIREDFARDLAMVGQAADRPNNRDAILAVIQVGSTNIDGNIGILESIGEAKNRNLYLRLMEDAWYKPFKEILAGILERGVRSGEFPQMDIPVFCEIFEALNRQANRGEILGRWSPSLTKQFAREALGLLGARLGMSVEINNLIKDWK